MPQGAKDRQLPELARFLEPLIGTESTAVAGSLLDRFGSLSTILAADAANLIDLTDDEARACTLLQAARGLTVEALRERSLVGIVDWQGEVFQEYLRAMLIGPEETLAAIFLDAAGGFLGDQVSTSGSAGSVGLCMRPLVRRALDLQARAIIFAHNHPSGSVLPSEEDIRETRKARALLEDLEITLIDHFIVTERQICSMRTRGVI